MKNLQFILIIILMTACSGVKKVVETAPAKTPKALKSNDSISSESNNIESNKAVTKVTEPTKLLEGGDGIDYSHSETFNHDRWNKLLKKHVSPYGNVNYEAFTADKKTLSNYISYLGENSPNNTWNKEDKLAYWINAYNAMTIDLILRHYPLNSIKDIKNPWNQRYWKLGEKWYNLNDIEHNILRKMDEPRIHFAIVCASFSCPKLRNEAYTAVQLEHQLTLATKDFLSDHSRNNISAEHLELSKIFQWFAKDFQKNGELIDFLNQYSDIKISAKAKKSFKDYNWSLNN